LLIRNAKRKLVYLEILTLPLPLPLCDASCIPMFRAESALSPSQNRHFALYAVGIFAVIVGIIAINFAAHVPALATLAAIEHWAIEYRLAAIGGSAFILLLAPACWTATVATADDAENGNGSVMLWCITTIVGVAGALLVASSVETSINGFCGGTRSLYVGDLAGRTRSDAALSAYHTCCITAFPAATKGVKQCAPANVTVGINGGKPHSVPGPMGGGVVYPKEADAVYDEKAPPCFFQPCDGGDCDRHPPVAISDKECKLLDRLGAKEDRGPAGLVGTGNETQAAGLLVTEGICSAGPYLWCMALQRSRAVKGSRELFGCGILAGGFSIAFALIVAYSRRKEGCSRAQCSGGGGGGGGNAGGGVGGGAGDGAGGGNVQTGAVEGGGEQDSLVQGQDNSNVI
jgi:uncharacterized membrane protein YgcG